MKDNLKSLTKSWKKNSRRRMISKEKRKILSMSLEMTFLSYPSNKKICSKLSFFTFKGVLRISRALLPLSGRGKSLRTQL